MTTHHDAIVVGAGLAGVYAIHRLRGLGLDVLGLEAASGVGGVWRHNRYPGARVDLESLDYCFYFSPELYRDWRWSERYAAQPELLAYVEHVADRFDIRRSIRFDTPMTGATWAPEEGCYHVKAGEERFTCRFLVMATGNLSAARAPDFPGLADFQGRWVQTSHWPEEPVAVAGKRVGVIGTGSSGVQVIPQLAKDAAHLTVFQRTPNFSVPAQNRALDEGAWQAICADVPDARRRLFATRAGALARGDDRAAAAALSFEPAQREAMMEAQWARGGQAFKGVFGDVAVDVAANEVVSEFARRKIRGIVADPVTAEALCPKDHPIGSRRLCLDIGYYETFNRPNVTLVDVSADRIDRITPGGIRLASGREVELDLIVFALGFHAFSGAIEQANIRDARGAGPTDHWDKGPKTLLGLMTTGFPNLFMITGPGSPSVLANMTCAIEHHVDYVADLIAHMEATGRRTVEPTEAAQDAWMGEVAEAASKLLRLKVKNYMVHETEDGGRVFIPYVGGMDAFVRRSAEIAAADYAGFMFDGAAAQVRRPAPEAAR